MLANITACVAGGLNHDWKVHHLPKECSLEDELNIVPGTAVELEGHVLRTAVEALYPEVPLLATAAPTPIEPHNLCIGRQEERRRLIFYSFFIAAEVIAEVAFFILDDHGLVLSEPDQLPDFL